MRPGLWRSVMGFWFWFVTRPLLLGRRRSSVSRWSSAAPPASSAEEESFLDHLEETRPHCRPHCGPRPRPSWPPRPAAGLSPLSRAAPVTGLVWHHQAAALIVQRLLVFIKFPRQLLNINIQHARLSQVIQNGNLFSGKIICSDCDHQDGQHWQEKL